MTLLLRDVVGVLERLYPPCTAQSWDQVGLVTGDPDQPIERILLALDPTLEVIEEARRDNLMTSSSVQRGQPQSNGRSTATPAKPHGKRDSGSLRKRPGGPAKTP